MNIKELRQLTGLSQIKFANKYHLNQWTLKEWEQNRVKTPEPILYLLERLITEIDYKEQ